MTAPDIRNIPPQSLGKIHVQLPPTWLPLGTAGNRTKPWGQPSSSNTPVTLKPNCHFYSPIPKLNHSKHGDDLRFTKPIDHYANDAGSQAELPVLAEEAGGRGGRGRPLQGLSGRSSSLSHKGAHAEVVLRDPCELSPLSVSNLISK